MYQRKNLILKKLSGLTLIEWMIACVLSFFMMSSLSVIYLGAERNNQLLSSLNTMQDNADSALNFLSRDIREAGDIGCPQLTKTFPFFNHSDISFSSENKITVKKSEIIIRHRSYVLAHLVEPMHGKTKLHLSETPVFAVGDIVLISDCQSADLFVIKSVTKKASSQIITPQTSLSKSYNVDAEIGHFDVNTYYVDDTHRKTASSIPIYALYVQDRRGHKVEWVEGIDSLQVVLDPMRGISITLTVSSFTKEISDKTWYSYVAFRNGENTHKRLTCIANTDLC